MRLLDRYVGRTVIGGALLALLLFASLETFFTLLRELEDTGRGGYSGWEAFVYVMLTLPRRAYDVLPYAALVGALFSLGTLAAHSELIAVRAAGVSTVRFAGAVLKAGVLLLAGAMVVGEAVAPVTEQYAQSRKAQVQSEKVIFRSVSGFWIRDGLSFINIRDIFPDGHLGGIDIYEFDGDHRLLTATHARGALFVKKKWRLEGIEQSRFEESRVVSSRTAEAEWASLISPELLDVVVIKPDNLSLGGLIRYIRYLRDNRLESGPYEYALWTKLVAPVATLIMLLLAVPFVFGPLRSASAGLRLLTGALVGVGFHIFSQAVGYLSVIYGLDPLLSAAFPSLLVLAAAVALLRRVG